MYATCIWCNGSLGRNESVEQFPVGRRIAFDQVTGRLWVVCQKCERWNLSPLEERWEAIEACERLYRDSPKRVHTDNIGLARVGDGLDLVRIGSPMLPEFAGWRYGDQFGRRHRRSLAIGAAVVAGAGVALYGQLALGISVLGLWNIPAQIHNIVKQKRRIGQFTTATGAVVPLTVHSAGLARIDVNGTQLAMAVRRHGEEWAKVSADCDIIDAIRHDGPARRMINSSLELREWYLLEGDAARTALSTILPIVNRAGGSRSVVQESIRLVEQRLDHPALLPIESSAGASRREPLWKMPIPRRLAPEMMLHESEERRWLEGEFADLETRWREADEIAGIADALTLPAGIDEQLDALRKKPTPSP